MAFDWTREGTQRAPHQFKPRKSTAARRRIAKRRLELQTPIAEDLPAAKPWPPRSA